LALTCQLSLSYASMQAGQTPPPQLMLQVYNPNAAAVVVTGVEMYFTDPQGNVQRPPVNVPVVPIGPGQSTTVPALSSVNIGPFPIAVGSVAAASSFQMVPPGAQPGNPQGAMPAQSQLFIGARVSGSDGSVNDAGKAGLLVSYTIAPPLGYQGGFAQFNGPNNAVLLAGVL